MIKFHKTAYIIHYLCFFVFCEAELFLGFKYFRYQEKFSINIIPLLPRYKIAI